MPELDMPDLDSSLDTVRATDDSSVRLREGLPPGFRMRADAHYVEQLDSDFFSPPARPDPVAAPPPAVLSDPGAGFEELAQSLSALVSATTMISGGTALSQSVASDLVRAEAGRALRLLTSMRVLRDHIPARRSRLLARVVVERVAQTTTAECRLQGVEVIVRTAAGMDTVVLGDEDLLVNAIAGLVGASCALMGSKGSRPVVVGAAVQDEGRVVAFTVSQQVVAVPESWMSYAFEKAWPVGAGSAEALLALQAARTVAMAHEGRAAAAAVRDGTTLTLAVPAFTRDM